MEQFSSDLNSAVRDYSSFVGSELGSLCECAADGNEGGRHNLITAAVGNGNLYICQVSRRLHTLPVL